MLLANWYIYIYILVVAKNNSICNISRITTKVRLGLIWPCKSDTVNEILTSSSPPHTRPVWRGRSRRSSPAYSHWAACCRASGHGEWCVHDGCTYIRPPGGACRSAPRVLSGSCGFWGHGLMTERELLKILYRYYKLKQQASAEVW